MTTFSDEKTPKNAKNFYCELCDFNGNKNADYTRHISTRKHQERTKKDKLVTPKNATGYMCEFCCKDFKSRNGLWCHKKKCKKTCEEDIDDYSEFSHDVSEGKNNTHNISPSVIETLVQQNSILISHILKNDGTVNSHNNFNNSNNVNTTNNTNNNNFNLNFFLNETCKDAMNLEDFINSLNISFEDLEEFGENGFVSGITRIFLNGLRQLDINKRPVHCSDLKREVLYLKIKDAWEKDDTDKRYIRDAIKKIANKGIDRIWYWKEAHPDCKEHDSKNNDLYMQMVLETMGKKVNDNEVVYYNKVIRNISNETFIDKKKDLLSTV